MGFLPRIPSLCLQRDSNSQPRAPDQGIDSSHLVADPGCCFTAFSTFICSTLDDGTRYLRRDAALDCDADAHKAMEGYSAVAILVWPIGMPLLYMIGFWKAWPMISQLRRAEVRAKSTKALSKARRQSVTRSKLLEGDLLVTVTFGGGDSDAPSDAAQESGGAPPFAAGTRCHVWLSHGQLHIEPPPGEVPMQLELLAECRPQLQDDGTQLAIEGTLAAVSDEAEDGRRAQLTLAPVEASPQPLERQLSILGVQLPNLMTPRRRGSASPAGPALQQWMVVVDKEVPDPELSLEDAEKELRKLRLAPILLPYELRTYWWELFECGRKLSIVGLPVFFEPGSSEQLTFGLLICFLTIAIFAYAKLFEASAPHSCVPVSHRCSWSVLL
jgi:hypothetical protein